MAPANSALARELFGRAVGRSPTDRMTVTGSHRWLRQRRAKNLLSEAVGSVFIRNAIRISCLS